MTDSEPVVLSGRYELHSRIARGGMAEVYLARDQLLDRPVAIKVLFPEFAVDPAFVERFRREAQSAANLNHSSIVGVYDWGAYEGTYYIVMEYVRGRALAEVLRAEGTLHPDRAADITIDIAGALSFAHRNGVVHRDIKPGNVLISPQGQVKVADFGIARAMRGANADNLTQTGSVMGTATYFSPEQAQGLSVDPRSDLYSLGVVLYEMLAGRPPFSGDGPVAIAYKHVQEAPVPLRQINPAVPPALEAICMKLLAKNPVNRYASAEDLRADLRRYREGAEVLAEPVLDPGAVAATSAVTGLSRAAGVDRSEPVGSRAQGGRQSPYGQLRSGDGTTVMTGIDSSRDDFEPPRRTWAFVGVLAALLVVLLGLLVALARVLTSDGGSSDSGVVHELPDVVGMDLADARLALTDLNFVVSINRVKNVQVPLDEVISQIPVAGVKAEEGSTVVLTVSSNESSTSLPNLVGTTETDARKVLAGLGFSNIAVVKKSSDRPKGEVLEQNPPANTEVDKAAVVTLAVSEGNNTVKLPSVNGRTCVDATKALVAAGLLETKVSCQDTPSATVERGKAIGTDPQGEVAKDTEVRILISSGPAKVKVPSVVGLTQSSAETQLLGLGLQVRVEFVTRADRVDRVVDQTPADGSEVDAGSTVKIVVGVAPTTTTSASTTTGSTTTTTTTT